MQVKCEAHVAREYPEHPMVGVAAVVLRGEDVLLVQRGREPAKGTWGLPGGLLDLGESVKDGVRREVLEECGVIVDVGRLVAVFEPLERDGDGRVRFHFVVLDYLASYVSGDVQHGDDAADARWVSLDSLDLLPMLDVTRDVIYQAAAKRTDTHGAHERNQG